MIKIKGGGEPIARGKTAATHAPYALTKTVTPELYGARKAKKKPKRPVTKSHRRANIVTTRNAPEKGGDHRFGKVKAPSPPPDREAKVGRPKMHATAADRQRAYRERQKVAR